MARKTTVSLDSIKQRKEEADIAYFLAVENAWKSDNPIERSRALEHMIEFQKANPNLSGNREYAQMTGGKSDLNDNQKSYIYDPNGYNGSDYRNKNTYVSYDALYHFSHIPLVRAIIDTRIDQVTAFCEPQKDIYSKGFRILPTNGDSKNLTSRQKDDIDYLTRFILECGENKYFFDGDNFDSFIRKFVRDSLRYDQATFEIVWNNYGFRSKKGRPAYFIATDASMYRFANNNSLYDMQNIDMPSYVMLNNGVAEQEFYQPELCFAIRNEDTKLQRNGYGRSEIEDLIGELNSFVNSMEYNQNYFKQGSMPKGFLRFGGDANDARIDEFRRSWQATVQGVRNAHRIPIIGANSLEFIDMMKSNKDMEFASWLETLIKIVCASYKIDPSEIGFNLSSSGASTVFESNKENAINESKSKGLYPLLKFVQVQINKFIVHQLNPDYTFHFVGTDGITREMELKQEELVIKNSALELSSYKTMNEVRKEKGLPPIENGDYPMNTAYLQMVMQLKNQQAVQPPE